MSDSEKKYFLLHESFLSGGIAGCVAKTAISPFDRMKIIYQISSVPFSYRSGLQTLREIIKEEGYLGLWRGNLPTMMRIFPSIGIQFAIYDFLRHMFYNTGGISGATNFISGSIAGVVGSAIIYPLELLRTRMAMVGTTRSLKMHEIVTRTVRIEGLKGRRF